MPKFAEDNYMPMTWGIIGGVMPEYDKPVAMYWFLVFIATAFIRKAYKERYTKDVTRQERLRAHLTCIVAAFPAILLLLCALGRIVGFTYAPAYWAVCNTWVTYIGVGFAFGLVRWLKGFRGQPLEGVEDEAVSEAAMESGVNAEPVRSIAGRKQGAVEPSVQTLGRR